MDLSKLPKLSDTRAAEGEPNPTQGDPTPLQRDPAPVQVEPIRQTAPYREPTTPRPPPMLGVDVWISTILGVLFVFMGMSFFHFAVAKLTHQPYHTGWNWPDDDPAGRGGQEVSYFDLQGYTAWTDMGAFLFGLSLLLEAASKSAVVLRPGGASRALLALATLISLATVGLNLIACGLLMHVGIIPLLSGIAVAFGGWILYDEWTTLKLSARVRTPAAPHAGREGASDY